MPADRVFLSASWQYLAMLNYEVDPRLLAPFIPVGTERDQWQGKTFVSLVGFCFLNTKLFGALAIPMHSNFEEVNLRFYVRRHVGDEVRRGVVFIREMVPRRAIAWIARTLYNEKYVALPMAHEICSHGDDRLLVVYRWRSEKRWSALRVETEGIAEIPSSGSAEQFITEHYWGYAALPGSGCVEYRVTHPAWKVWQVRHASFAGDGKKFYGEELAAVVCSEPQSAFLAEGSPVIVMRGQRWSERGTVERTRN